MPQQWTKEEISHIFQMPILELVFEAQKIHRNYFKPNQVKTCSLLNIKTGACPEDCGYCAQSGHYKTGLKKEKLLSLEQVISSAKAAKEIGATRFCMGAAWRSPNQQDLMKVEEMIRAVKDLGLETCVTLGMLNASQAQSLKNAGLDFYNHNLDTSPEYYKEIITTHTYEDRLNTLNHVRNANIKVCSGGIIGMGETREDRIGLLQQLANLPQQPCSVPINHLEAIPGTPLEDATPLDSFEFVRTIATARILMPKAYIRLCGGRAAMSDELQTLCFIAGANSIFYGEKLLTVKNPRLTRDLALFNKLGLAIEKSHAG